MKSVQKIGFLFVLSYVMTGCALAPFSTNTTGRTLNRGGFEFQGGMFGTTAGGGVFQGKLAFGLSENFDFGFQYEVVSLGVFAKYGFINPKDEGFALSALGGTGISGTGTYYYLGPIASYKFDRVEPYAQVRWNHVSYGETKGDIDLGVLGNSDFTIPAGSYSYLGFTAGLVVWPVHWLGFSVEGTKLEPFSVNDRVVFANDRGPSVWSAAAHFRF